MQETISISALNQYIFCPRRCALMHVEGVWSENAHTAQGTILHKNTDERGYESDGAGARIVRALPLFSEKYNLNGKADIVEFRPGEIIPVEYKKGKRRQFENDDIQLCAQGLCLEEMFQKKVKRGFIYHAASRRRREVIFDEDLRQETIGTIDQVRRLLSLGTVPAAHLLPRCAGCSLRETCLPELSDPNYRRKLGLNSSPADVGC